MIPTGSPTRQGGWEGWGGGELGEGGEGAGEGKIKREERHCLFFVCN